MAEPNEEAAQGRRPVSVYVVAISAIIFAIVLVVANLFVEREIDERISALDEKDLRATAARQRLPATFTPVAEAAGPWAIEGEVYVPVYSSIYAGQGSLRSDLAATLSIRNTSHSEPIVVRDVRYFDSDGKLVSHFVEEPHRLGPMATADFFIDATDVRGGTGANFVVSWASATAVSEPVIEAIMIGSIGAKGISFVSRGTRVGTSPATSAPAAE